MPRCLDAARNATLNVVESLLDLEGELGYNIIMSHVDQLLESLRVIVVTAWTAPVSSSFLWLLSFLLNFAVSFSACCHGLCVESHASSHMLNQTPGSVIDLLVG